MNVNKTVKQVGIILLLVTMPLAIGIPLFLVYDKPEFLEVPLAAFGVLELLVLTVTIQVRDNKKRKAGRLLKEDKDSDEYQNYINFRKIILISSFINLVLSLVAFLMFGR
ncbi:MAG TPA: hypothetical protein GXZ51_00930 [Acholeplasma sp.]|nr:hypothetical protein [Acholeplasma sp.]